MKIPVLCTPFFLLILFLQTDALAITSDYSYYSIVKENDSILRHVVLFKFKEGTSAENIKQVEDAFVGLKTKIPGIVSLEWGLNNSPEGLNKGFTHCFFLSFHSEADRDAYLPHPDHKAFGELLGPVLEDVLVVDYWTD